MGAYYSFHLFGGSWGAVGPTGVLESLTFGLKGCVESQLTVSADTNSDTKLISIPKLTYSKPPKPLENTLKLP